MNEPAHEPAAAAAGEPAARPSLGLEGELRLTSDSLLRALDELHDLEARKREVPTGTAHFLDLARRVEELSIEVLRRTEREASLAEDLRERTEAGAPTGRPINDIPDAERPLATILAEWREAERTLASASPTSVEASAAAAAVRRLREEYRMAHERRTQNKA
jgi:hypothetical protein